MMVYINNNFYPPFMCSKNAKINFNLLNKTKEKIDKIRKKKYFMKNNVKLFSGFCFCACINFVCVTEFYRISPRDPCKNY